MCEICGENQAVVFIQQVIGNEKYSLKLCDECAQERGITSDNGESIQVSISGLLSGLIEDQEDFQNGLKQPAACPRCGMDLESIRKNGQVGCSTCYQTYGWEIREMLSEMVDEDVKHTGKYPKLLTMYKEYIEHRDSLKEELKFAVENEEYEHAAVLRDRLEDLEKSKSIGRKNT